MGRYNFEIFRHYKDRDKWQKYHEWAQNHPSLTVEEKRNLVNAYVFLEGEFGKGFLKQKKTHPLRFLIVSLNDRTYTLVTSFAVKLHTVREQFQGYIEILTKLRSSKMYSEGKVLLEFLFRFHSEGFGLAYEKNYPGKKGQPDIRIEELDSDEHLFFELNNLEEPEKQRRQSDSYLFVFEQAVKAPIVPFSGKLYGLIKEEMRPIIAKKIQILKAEAINNGGLCLLDGADLSDILTLGFSSHESVSHLQEWAEIRGLKVGDIKGIGTPIEKYQQEGVRRIKRNIERKCRKYSGPHPLFIALQLPGPYIFFQDWHSLHIEVLDYITRFPNLLGVLLHTELAKEEAPANGYQFGMQWIKVLSKDSYSHELSILVMNEACKVNFSPGFLSRFLRSIEPIPFRK